MKLCNVRTVVKLSSTRNKKCRRTELDVIRAIVFSSSLQRLAFTEKEKRKVHMMIHTHNRKAVIAPVHEHHPSL